MPRENNGIERYWNLELVNAEHALARLSRHQNGKINWKDTSVALIDTGYTDHPVFGQFPRNTHLDYRLGDNYKDSPGSYPKDPINYGGMLKNPGHGSRIGSILCGLPIQDKFDGGVAPGVPTVPYRVTNTVFIGRPATSINVRVNIARAIRRAIDFNQVKVINLSLGIPMLMGKRQMGKAVDYAYEKGVIICAAAGQITNMVTYPGKLFRTIGCGAVSHNRTIWNTDLEIGYDEHDLEHIDVWAPGNDIYRPVIRLDQQGRLITNRYQQVGEGTSYATAHTSAAAAIWLTHNKTQIDRLYKNTPWRIIEAFRFLIKKTHIPIQGSQRPYHGTGILDIDALLNAPLPSPDSLNKETRKAEKMWA